MKTQKLGKLVISAVVASMLLGTSVFAEPGSETSENDSIKSRVLAEKTDMIPKNVVIKTVAPSDFTKNETFESTVINATKELAEADAIMANLLAMSHTIISSGNHDNLVANMNPTMQNLLTNMVAFFDKFAEKDPIYKKDAQALKDKLEKVYGYSFGPERTTEIDITQVSNEGKGTVKVGERDVRYVVTPGLTATKQNEREVIAVEKLADGEYKIAYGIFYSGQEKVTLNWDERTWTKITGKGWYLDFHNVNEDLQDWLTCGKSKCVPFSENKTVNTKK